MTALTNARGIKVGGTQSTPTRWLGVWLDSQLTLKEYQDVRVKKASKIDCEGSRNRWISHPGATSFVRRVAALTAPRTGRRTSRK